MHSCAPDYRQLQPEDRMKLDSMQQQNYKIRAGYTPDSVNTLIEQGACTAHTLQD